MVRDQLSEELWLELNIYLFFRNGDAEDLYNQGSDLLLDRITRFSLVFQGLADATIPHGEGWALSFIGQISGACRSIKQDARYFKPPSKEPTRADLMSVFALLYCIICFSSAVPWQSFVKKCASFSSVFRRFSKIYSILYSCD